MNPLQVSAPMHPSARHRVEVSCLRGGGASLALGIAAGTILTESFLHASTARGGHHMTRERIRSNSNTRGYNRRSFAVFLVWRVGNNALSDASIDGSHRPLFGFLKRICVLGQRLWTHYECMY